MKRTVKIALTASVVLAAAATTAGLQAQQSAMTFFVTSAGSGNGGNLGGLEGADAICQKLATAAGAGSKTWRAYLSTTGAKSVNARDRIGRGPWQNAKGETIARTLDDLHSDKNNLTKQTALTETGQVVNGRGDKPNMHDILTGSSPEGTRRRRRREGHDLQQLDQRGRRFGDRRAPRPPGPRHLAAGAVLEFVARLEGLLASRRSSHRRQRLPLLLRVELISVSQTKHGRRASPGGRCF